MNSLCPLLCCADGALMKQAAQKYHRAAAKVERGDPPPSTEQLIAILKDASAKLEYAGQLLGDLGWALHDEKQKTANGRKP